MADKNLAKYYPMNTIKIDFNKLIRQDQDLINEICLKLNIDTISFSDSPATAKKELNHKSKNVYTDIEGDELNELMTELPFMKSYCNG